MRIDLQRIKKPSQLKALGCALLLPAIGMTFSWAGPVKAQEAPAAQKPALPEVCAATDMTAEACAAHLAEIIEVYEAQNKNLLARLPESQATPLPEESQATPLPEESQVAPLPEECSAAKLTVEQCTQYLSENNRIYREQSINLLAKIKGYEDQQGEPLSPSRAELEASLAKANTGAQTTAKELEQVRAQLLELQASPPSTEITAEAVCAALARRLNARQALGAYSPPIDETACAENPLAELRRHLADVHSGREKADMVVPPTVAAPPLAALDDQAVPPEPPAVTADAAPTASATCAPPTPEQLRAFIDGSQNVFGGLSPVRQNRLLNELGRGTKVGDALQLAWPNASAQDSSKANALLCDQLSELCPQGSALCD